MVMNKYLKAAALLILSSYLICACQMFEKQESIDAEKTIESPSNQRSLSKRLPQPNGYISDFENLFSASEIKNLDSIITDIEKKTTVQIVVVTLDSTMTNSDNFEDFTWQLANDWGVGQKGKDNGILIGISAGLRKIRIQNGKGIEKKLSNEDTKLIVDSVFIPSFRQGNYFEGTNNGIHVLMNILGETMH
jgi:uncharacterized protein